MKISSKGWSGSQRRISSLPEETVGGNQGQAGQASGYQINSKIGPPRSVKSIAVKKGEDTAKLLKYIDDNVIGKNGTFFGPFGRRKGKILRIAKWG